jgi:hypothetical protein
MSIVLPRSMIARWAIVLAANGLVAFLAYTLLRGVYFTPHQWVIDIIFLVLVSNAHFCYMPSQSLRFRTWSGVVSACLNALLMFWVAVALGNAP